MPTVAAQQQGAQPRFAGQARQGRQQRPDQVAVIGVANLGSIEHDVGDPAGIDARQ